MLNCDMSLNVIVKKSILKDLFIKGGGILSNVCSAYVDFLRTRA